MTEQELFQEMLKAVSDDKELTAILEKIKNKTATFEDTQRYSLRTAEIKAKILGQNLSPAGTGQNEENCYQLLKDQHEDVFRKESAVQTALDQKQNLHISPVRAAFPADRVRKAAHSLEDTTVSEDVIRRRAENAVANIANSFHDDYIKENSSFRQKAGLTCHVSRIGAFECCPWCAKLAGKYEKGSEPAEFWQRHDGCSCQIVYENQKVRQRLSGTGQGWQVRAEVQRRRNAAKTSYKLTRFTPEQAAALEHQRLSQYRGLTVAGKTDLISLRDNNRNEIKITDEVINSLQKIDVFEDDTINQAVLKHTKELLQEAQKHTSGTEIGKHVPLDLNPDNVKTFIGEENGHTVNLGKCKISAVTIHNHPSGETFSRRDIDKFVIDENAKAMYVIGNNGKWYALRKNENFDWMQFQIKTFTISDAPDFNEQILKGANNYGFTYYHKG